MRQHFFALAAVAVILSGCSITGPSRLLKMIGPSNVADFSTFEGVAATPCYPVTINSPEMDGAPVGCVFQVRTVSSNANRNVFCAAGSEFYSACRGVPLNSRVSVNARPLPGEAGMSFAALSVNYKRE